MPLPLLLLLLWRLPSHALHRSMERSSAAPAFPTARVKRMMQSDDDVGKMSKDAPAAVSRALELFLADLVGAAAREAGGGAAAVLTCHLKAAIGADSRFDTLSAIVEGVADAPGAAPAPAPAPAPAAKRGRAGGGGAKAKAMAKPKPAAKAKGKVKAKEQAKPKPKSKPRARKASAAVAAAEAAAVPAQSSSTSAESSAATARAAVRLAAGQESDEAESYD